MSFSIFLPTLSQKDCLVLISVQYSFHVNIFFSLKAIIIDLVIFTSPLIIIICKTKLSIRTNTEQPILWITFDVSLAAYVLIETASGKRTSEKRTVER